MTEVERAKKGDPEAFIRLIDANRDTLLRVAHGFFRRRLPWRQDWRPRSRSSGKARVPPCAGARPSGRPL